MSSQTEGIGCRDAALSTLFLLGFGIVQFAIGLTLINRDTCVDLCETVGLTLLYSGAMLAPNQVPAAAMCRTSRMSLSSNGCSVRPAKGNRPAALAGVIASDR